VGGSKQGDALDYHYGGDGIEIVGDFYVGGAVSVFGEP